MDWALLFWLFGLGVIVILMVRGKGCRTRPAPGSSGSRSSSSMPRTMVRVEQPETSAMYSSRRGPAAGPPAPQTAAGPSPFKRPHLLLDARLVPLLKYESHPWPPRRYRHPRLRKNALRPDANTAGHTL